MVAVAAVFLSIQLKDGRDVNFSKFYLTWSKTLVFLSVYKCLYFGEDCSNCVSRLFPFSFYSVCVFKVHIYLLFDRFELVEIGLCFGCIQFLIGGSF